MKAAPLAVRTPSGTPVVDGVVDTMLAPTVLLIATDSGSFRKQQGPTVPVDARATMTADERA